MKSAFIVGTTLFTAANAMSLKEATRVERSLAAYNLDNAKLRGDACTFMSISQLNPGFFSGLDQSNTNDAYFGSFYTTYAFPESNDYAYYVAVGMDAWKLVKGSQQNDQGQTISIAYCVDEGNCISSSYGGFTVCQSALDDKTSCLGVPYASGYDVKPYDPDQFLTSPVVGTCATGSSSGSSPTITCLHEASRNYYIGVENICGRGTHIGHGEVDFATSDPDREIFLWFTHTPTMTAAITFDSAGHVVSTDLIDNHVSDGDSVFAEGTGPDEILFVAPARTDTSATVLNLVDDIDVSYVREVTTVLEYNYLEQDIAVDWQAEAPSRCTFVSESSNPTGGLDPDDAPRLVERANYGCSAQYTIDAKINVLNAVQSSISCPTSGASVDERGVELVGALVQFVRRGSSLAAPTQTTDLAEKLVEAAAPNTWSCLTTACTGDPYLILAEKHIIILTADDGERGEDNPSCIDEDMNPGDKSADNADVLATCQSSDQYMDGDGDELEIQIVLSNRLANPLSIEDATSAEWNSENTDSGGAPYSYVVGVLDFVADDCGAPNDGNAYPMVRRLGTAQDGYRKHFTSMTMGPHKQY